MLRDLKQLFRSTARVKILMRMLLSGEVELYQGQIAAAEKLPLRAVQRELTTLAKIGLVSSRRRERRRYYRLKTDHLLYRDLKSIFVKAAMLAPKLRAAAADRPGSINAAFVFGSVAIGGEREGSDVDLIVVGSISEDGVDELLEDAPLRAQREVNPMVYTEASFRRAIRRGEGFLRRVMAGPKIFLVGDESNVSALAGLQKA